MGFLVTVALVWIWVFPDIQRQDKNVRSAIALLVCIPLIALWGLLLSRMPWRHRLLFLAGYVGLLVIVGALFRIREVSGDLVPLLEYRWAEEHTVTYDPVHTERAIAPVPESSNGSEPDFGPGYPQFLGPNRNAKVNGPLLARDWNATPPDLLWRQPIGTSWSGFAISGSIAITQEQRKDEELVVAYELLTGNLLWLHADEARYKTTIGGLGPRATPTIDGDRVFTVGATGILNCLELATGALLWSRNMAAENHAHTPDWGYSGSPLIWNEKVIVCPGGKDERSLVAYHSESGELLWGGGSDPAHYSSPARARLLRHDQILIFNAFGLVAHNPDDGSVQWKYAWPRGHPHVAMPVLLPDSKILVSSGYGAGSELLQIAFSADEEPKWSARRVWRTRRLKAKFTNVIHHKGFIYGLNDGSLVCLEASDGNLKWKGERYGHGQMILAGNLMLVTTEYGDVVLLEPVPEESRVLSRISVFGGKSWNPPALTGNLLLIRNHREAACYRLPLAITTEALDGKS